MNSVPLGLIGLFVGVPHTFILMWLIYMVHIYTEKAENLLPNSNFVELNIKIYSPAGLMGKAMRNGFLTLALLNPKLLAKRGLVDLKDVKNFPRKLKWMFVTSWASCSLFTVSLVIFGAYIKYIDKSPAI